MLEPNARKLLLDCLQPPEEFELDQAVGTTYSLDLYALLSIPVAFVFREAVTEDGRIDPLATLEALRRYADRIHLFCQSGAIHVPRGQERLFAYLEDSVVPVMPKSESGVFHPKTWLLRFVGPDDAVTYRFICMSRNLTFDRSWDTMLALEGVRERKRVRDPNPRPLRDFLQALPGLAAQPVRNGTREAIQDMAEELPYVRFACPPDVESLRFWPMGVAGKKVPTFLPAHRPLLVVSPFLSEAWLQQNAQGRSETFLVSREDQLLAMSRETLDRFDESYTLVQEATPEEDLEAQGEEENLLDGLHAKFFAMDDGWNARIWTGSANATNAAFHHNIEMLVELVGKKSKLGIDTFLKDGDAGTGFRELLDHWQPPDAEIDGPDPIAERLDERLRAAQRSLASANLIVAVSEAGSEDHYSCTIDGDWPELPVNTSGSLWPIGLEREQARPLSGEAVIFDTLTLEALSAFIAIELAATENGHARHTSFVLRLPITGLPANRNNRLLRHMLRDRREFMRLMMLLLSDGGLEAMMNAALPDSTGNAAEWLPGLGEAPLLESLLKALDRSPERLDQIHRLLDDLRESGDVPVDEFLPDGFGEVWEAVWANRKKAVANV